MPLHIVVVLTFQFSVNWQYLNDKDFFSCKKEEREANSISLLYTTDLTCFSEHKPSRNAKRKQRLAFPCGSNISANECFKQIFVDVNKRLERIPNKIELNKFLNKFLNILFHMKQLVENIFLSSVTREIRGTFHDEHQCGQRLL